MLPYDGAMFKSGLWRYHWFLAAIAVTSLWVLWFMSPVPVIEQVTAPATDNARYFFGDTRTIGQSFVAVPRLHAIEIPLELEQRAQGPLLLHIRRDYFGSDIRTSVVYKPAYGVQQFTFPELSAAGETLVWILESPNDFDRTAAVYREIDGAGYPVGTAFEKGHALAGDFAFSQMGSHPLIADINRVFPHDFSQSLLVREEQNGLIAGILAGLVVVGAARFIVLRPGIVLICLAGATLVLHVIAAQHLLFNNDEGAYLQDAFQVWQGLTPVKDFLTKGPVYVYLLAVWSKLVPITVSALRLLSAFFWMACVGLAYWLGRELRLSRAVSLSIAMLLALSPATVFLSTQLLLQTVSVPLTVAALALAVRGARLASSKLVTLSAFFMVCAYLTRATSAAAAVVGLGILLALAGKARWRLALSYAVWGIGIAGVIALLAVAAMGPLKTAVLFNVEATVISQEKQSTPGAAAPEPFIRVLTQNTDVLWRTSPWFIAGFLTCPWYLMRYRRRLIKIIVLTAWIFGVAQVLFHLNDFSYFISSQYVLNRLLMFTALVGPAVIVGVWDVTLRRLLPPLPQPQKGAVIMSLVWLGLLTCAYAAWGNFRSNYLLEFLPPLACLTAIAAYQFWQLLTNRSVIATRLTLFFSTVLAVAGFVIGWHVSIVLPHSGSMDLGSLEQIVAAVKSHVPVGQPIFTAQSAITALAQRPIMFAYSHSGWYLYERQGLVPARLRQLLFQEPEGVTQYLFTQAQFVVTERRTNEVYFDTYPERKQFLAGHFETVATFPNSNGDAFTLYARKPTRTEGR